MAGEHYDSVPVRVERDDEQGVYKLGIVIDNAFVTFAAIKTGHVDELVQREQDKASERAEAERVQQQQREDQQRRDEYEQQRRQAEQPPQQPSTTATPPPPPPQTTPQS